MDSAYFFRFIIRPNTYQHVDKKISENYIPVDKFVVHLEGDLYYPVEYI